MLKTMDQISGHFNSELIDALKEGKSFRIVGDNINFQVGVSHARQSNNKVGHMEHWFGSAAIIQNFAFDQLSSQSPQNDLRILPATSFVFNESDWSILKGDLSLLIGRILTEFFPWLKFAEKAASEDIEGEHSQVLCTKNKVIPLPVLAKNEQKYSDVVEILDDYQSLVEFVHESAGIQMTSIHIGGDQLTRERFSGAKRLRAAAMTSSEKFSHLHPITFEFFHLQMTVLTTFYQILYQTSCTESFTLHSQKIRLMRKDADGQDVKNHYNHCKELAVSFIKGYVVEFACHYFNVNDTETRPCITIPDSSNMSISDIQDWLKQLVMPMVEMIFKESRNHMTATGESDDLFENNDMVEDYGKVVLELGLMVMELNDIIKVPDRKRILATLKYLMFFLKAHNNRSKYSLEILRQLCQQYALLSERDAYKSLYGLFVNTGGKINTHIPADLQMEYLVRLTKVHLRSMCSNASEKTMKKRSSAFYGMQEVAENFDHQTGVVIRAQKHSIPSSYEDEKKIINDLRSVKPFTNTPGRHIDTLKRAPKNTIRKLKLEEFIQWIEKHKLNFYFELGQ